MKNFEEYFSFEKFNTIITNQCDDTVPFFNALDQFLRENNLLKPFTNSETHRTNFGFYLNKYIQNQELETYEKKRLLEGLLHKTLFFTAYRNEKNIDNLEALTSSYKEFVEKIDNGNFHPFDVTDDLYDFESGERFNMKLEKWEPTLLIYTPGASFKDRGSFDVAPEEKVQKVVEKQIEFNTGNIIIADWFKIKKFTDLVDKDNHFDVNSEKGRIEQAKYYLEKFNFIFTTSWSSSDVYKNGDTYILANAYGDFNMPSSYKNKGHVDKELRAISIIEKETLIEMVGEDKVNAYLEEYTHSIVELKVKPGIYSFILSSSPNLIKEEYQNLESSQTDENKQEISNLIQNKDFQPNFIMQGLSLKPTKKPKMR